MGAGDCCAKFLLVLINVLVFLIGTVLLGAGIMVKVASDFIVKTVQPMLDNVLKSVPNISSSFGLAATSGSSGTAATPSLDIMVVLGPLATGLIVIGAVLFLVAALGCCGACCSVKCMLVLYVVMLSILVIGQIVLTSLVFTHNLDNQFKGQLKTSLKKYKGLDSFEMDSLLWNFVTMFFKCCGVDSYQDFHLATGWQRTRTVSLAAALPGGGGAVAASNTTAIPTMAAVTGTTTNSSNSSSNGMVYTITLITPFTCCKMIGTFPNVKPRDYKCATQTTDANSNWKKGCWDSLWEYFNDYKWYVIGGLIGIIVIQVLLIVCAIYLLTSADDNNKVGPS